MADIRGLGLGWDHVYICQLALTGMPPCLADGLRNVNEVGNANMMNYAVTLHT